MTADNSATIKAQRFLVSGRVQGVYFRASTRDQAKRLGLTGHARNLPDGRVEVLVIGDAAALAVLAKWLWQGPPSAQVSDVQATDVELDADIHAGFITL